MFQSAAVMNSRLYLSSKPEIWWSLHAFSRQRASAVDVMNAVTSTYEALLALTTHATQSWPLQSTLWSSTFATTVPSCKELRSSYQHTAMRALHRLSWMVKQRQRKTFSPDEQKKKDSTFEFRP